MIDIEALAMAPTMPKEEAAMERGSILSVEGVASHCPGARAGP
jgi:hypothetical protein